MTKGRVFLGRDQHVGGYRRVFEIEDGLEIDENNFVEIERTRVYFDDVLGITYHRQRSLGFLVGMALFVAFFGLIGLIGSLEGEAAVGVAFAGTASPFALAFVLHLVLKTDVITVFGRRTMARMRFGFRKQLARQIYRDLALKIRARQEKAAAAQAPPPPAPEVPLPPPPPAPPAAPAAG